MHDFFSTKPSRAFKGKDVAHFMQITHAAFSFILSGRSALTQISIVRLTRFLKIPVWDLVGYISNYKKASREIFIPPRGTYAHIADSAWPLVQRLKIAQAAHLQTLLLELDSELSQADLARRMNISRSAITYYFSGRILLNLESAILMAQVLEIDPAVVLSYLQDFDGLNP